jgi:hypothetical protein
MSDNHLLPVNAALATLEAKNQVVRDLVTGVAKKFKTGLFLHGDGGLGKSFTVLRHLEYLQATYQLYNSRMSSKGLLLAFKNGPDVIHVLEDMERLTNDADAQGVLRSALCAQPGHERVINWTTARDSMKPFSFSGGVIIISNRPLADMPELRALATRIDVHRLDVTEDELTALMYDLASRGYQHNGKMVMGPQECLEVTQHLLEECRVAGCRLNLRMQQKSFQTYLQWESDWSASHWRDLIAVSVRETTHHFRHESNTKPREIRKAERRNVIRELMGQETNVKEMERLYIEQTDASRADFYRRKREVETGDFDEQDAAA